MVYMVFHTKVYKTETVNVAAVVYSPSFALHIIDG